MPRLSTEVYYLQNSAMRGYCWFAVNELGRFGQVIDCVVKRPCANLMDARRLAAEALAQLKGKYSEA